MKISLTDRIYNYLVKYSPKKFNGGEIERLALSVGYKASNASRRCREMDVKGRIRSEMKGGSVWYWVEKEDTLQAKLDESNKWFDSLTLDTKWKR